MSSSHQYGEQQCCMVNMAAWSMVNNRELPVHMAASSGHLLPTMLIMLQPTRQQINRLFSLQHH